MKRTLSVIALLLALTAAPALSQTQQGGWEFSLSGAFASISSKSETSGSLGSRTHESESEQYFTLLFRPGFFVLDGLEIEPELGWGGASGVPPSFSFSGNASYNFAIPNTRVVPFVLAGYGIGNAIPILRFMVTRNSDAFDISVLNLGAGMKIFAAKAVAFRGEYRYQRFAQEITSGSGAFSSTTKMTYNFHNVFLGVSVFLP